MQLFEAEYQDILNKFKQGLKRDNKRLSYSITATPLRSSKYLILGNNWGGGSDIQSQTEMPLYNDILCCITSPTYRGVIDFLMEVFDHSKIQVIDFLNTIVYTNANFVRTSNESIVYRNEIEYGYNVSKDYVLKIIELINPKVIICFGNKIDDFSATQALIKALGSEDHYNFLKKAETTKTSNNWNIYRFPASLFDHRFEIFSFPHSSRFNYWKPSIQDNRIFKELKAIIKADYE